MPQSLTGWLPPFLTGGSRPFSLQGMLLVVLINASSDDEQEGSEAHDFCQELTLPIHTLTPFLASACQEVRPLAGIFLSFATYSASLRKE